MAVSFIGGGNRSTWTKRPVISHWQFCIEYTSPWTGFELTTSVVIGADCIGSCKSNYHTIMTTTVPVSPYYKYLSIWRSKLLSIDSAFLWAIWCPFIINLFYTTYMTSSWLQRRDSILSNSITSVINYIHLCWRTKAIK